LAEIRASPDHASLGAKGREGRGFSGADNARGNEPALAAAGQLHLEAIVADPDGAKLLRESRDGALDDPQELGNAVGDILLKRGGDAILAAVYGRGLALPPQP
jgi:hydroxymethylbilane synthase